MTKDLFSINTEVQSALAATSPLVALESTVIAHGLPRPQNIETAKRLESIVRDAGAVPATIAMFSGERCAHCCTSACSVRGAEDRGTGGTLNIAAVSSKLTGASALS